jgi:hypothetical protein
MNEFDGPFLSVAWLFLMPFVAIGLRAFLGSWRIAASVLALNIGVLIIFCSLWYSGFYFSEHWMHIIDLGAPWSWLGALFAISYGVSFLPLRRYSKATARSFVGPVITVPALWSWILFCALLFDPFP